MDHLGELATILRRKRFVTRTDAVALGISDGAFTHFAHRLRLAQLHQGVWAPEESELGHRYAAHAALTAVGEPSLLTGATALHLTGAIGEPPARVEVVVPLRRSPARRDGICVHHTSTYDRIRFRNDGDLRLASAARAATDYAAHATFTELAKALGHVDRLRLATVVGVQAELAARKRFAGRGTLRAVLADMAGEVAHSNYERLGRRLLKDAGHRPHPRPLEVFRNGNRIAEIDVAFPQSLYGVEIDGPHHLLAATAAADRVRDRRLNGAGWTIDRFFWFELDDRPQWFVAEVSRRLAERPQ